MYILGISCYYHDSSAALLKDGCIVSAAEEERFTRKKHDSSFPINAINFCLSSQNISIDMVDYIGFYEKPLLKFERLLYQNIDLFPHSYFSFLAAIPSWITQKLMVVKKIKKDLKYKGDILFINHHMAHAASAFLISPFKKAAIFTVDGVGEFSTTTYGQGEDNNIKLMKEIKFPNSVGLLYSTITAYLGFSVNNSEYKVMGLSAYGDMNRKTNVYYSKLIGIIDIKEDGSFRFDMSYFKYHFSNRMPSKKLCDLLGGPERKKESEITKRHKDIAAALQMITEDILTKMLIHIHKITKQDNLVMAGGVALNSVYNGKILKKTPFKKIWIQPNASDGGTSVGVVSYIYNIILGNRREYEMKTAYLGPCFSNEDIKNFLKEKDIKYSIFKSDKELVKKTAELIYKGKVIGWFQGKMEWGPRALGARSILSNACDPKMQDILNVKVKHREKFRPFAPVVCEEDAFIYFDCDMPLPEPAKYMLMVYPIKEKWRNKLPAVTHIDGSGRLQTINRKDNPLYYDLIKEFGNLSDIPVLINTSFNIRGEPIVCSPKDAYMCMMGTGIDALVMGSFFIEREHNLRDIWDSEKSSLD